MAAFELFLRMLLALGVTLGLLALVARLARRFQSGGRRLGAARRPRRPSATRGPEVEVLARRPLTKSTTLSVVRVGGRLLVLGATAQSVNLLTELEDRAPDADGLEEPEATPTTNGAPPWTGGPGATLPSAWDAAIAQLRERTVRR